MLFAWAKIVEQTLVAHNVSCNHPRKSKFHMTIARVDPVFPVDKAVAKLVGIEFGTHHVCSFIFEGERFYADDCNK